MAPVSAVLAASVMAAAIGGALAHELTHAAVAEMFGCETMLDIWNLDLYYRPSNGELGIVEERLILSAPAAIGWSTGIGAYLATGLPPARAEVLPIVLFWAVYTLLAGPSDFSVRIARTGDWWWTDLSWGWRRLIGGYGTLAIGIAIGHFGAPSTWPVAAQWFLDAVWKSLLFSSGVLIAWAMVTFENGGDAAAPASTGS